MRQPFQVHPVGWVRKRDSVVEIEIEPAYHEALLGIDGFSHIVVCYWLHENDSPDGRRRLQVHPRRNPANPLTGVFATHAPVRPNPIAITICRIVSVADGTIRIEEIDARDGSPVIDIKCHIPETIDPALVRVPDWV